MIEREILLYDFMQMYATALVSDIDDSQFALQPFPGANHPAWIIGHLCVCEDSSARSLGARSVCPEGWYDLFEPGTTPQSDAQRSIYPSKEVLFEQLDRGHHALCDIVRTVDDAIWSEPNPIDVLRELLPTQADAVAHVMTTHPAMHCGQLAAWRRAMGLQTSTPPPKIR